MKDCNADVGLRRVAALGRIVLTACALVMGSSVALAAPPVPAPSVVIQHPRNQLMVGRYLHQRDDGRYVFERIDDLRGPDVSPDQVVLRAPGWLVGYLSAGEQYLLTYSNYVPNPRFGKDFNIDTDGPRLVYGMGLEPALFRDSPGLRRDLLAPFDAARLQSAEFTAQLVAGLTGTDTQLQNFYAAEITQRTELAQRVDAPLVGAVRTLLANDDAHPSARAQLLRLAAQGTTFYSAVELQALARQVLEHAPLEGYQDLQPRSGELVRFTLEMVAEKSLPIELPVLERLVSCDSAGLAESALLAIRQLYPSAERPAAERALQQTLLPATTRAFLLDHLRRLDQSAASTPLSVR